jgi:hypothetical protein
MATKLNTKLAHLTKSAVTLNITDHFDYRLNGKHLTIFGIECYNPKNMLGKLHAEYNQTYFGTGTTYKLTVTKIGPNSIYVDIKDDVTNGVLYDTVQQMKNYVISEGGKLLTYRSSDSIVYPEHIEVGDTTKFKVGDSLLVYFDISA